MDLLISHAKESLGTGVSKSLVKDLEARLNIKLPQDYKNYLIQYNYAELYGDPIYGIHKDLPSIDLYARNQRTEHFKHGFLHIFTSDIDGGIYLRPDSGAIYRGFLAPVASSFSAFIEQIVSNGS